jgi:hypothetical protein
MTFVVIVQHCLKASCLREMQYSRLADFEDIKQLRNMDVFKYAIFHKRCCLNYLPVKTCGGPVPRKLSLDLDHIPVMSSKLQAAGYSI